MANRIDPTSLHSEQWMIQTTISGPYAGCLRGLASRFLPLFRTFAPFVAGIGAMNFGRFSLFNITGGLLWVGSLVMAGVLFGNIPVIRNNLSMMVVGIVVVSLIPAAIGWWKHRQA